ncbi:hypothetical protein CEXT_181651 [Caerostris extrusa]|uniref:Uncharacterized protein n=1 Tax=Caerostris extrusa TaxID=172846 RepID=A0AAV4MKK6_CAEEX|nr:hypothetical protein CEXT_181651 [Caerostris extrusa]
MSYKQTELLTLNGQDAIHNQSGMAEAELLNTDKKQLRLEMTKTCQWLHCIDDRIQLWPNQQEIINSVSKFDHFVIVYLS